MAEDSKKTQPDKEIPEQHTSEQEIITDDGQGAINIPRVIKASLKNPPLLPNESKDKFLGVYSDFLGPLAPETIPQHWLVWYAAVLTWEVMRYLRMKLSYTLNQRRAVVAGLIRKAFQATAMRAVRLPGSDIDDNIERYFTDPAYPALIAQALEKSGYTIAAVEAEMFARSLDGLVQIEKLIASAEKRLMIFFREMEKIHGDRAIRAQAIADKALKKMSK